MIPIRMYRTKSKTENKYKNKKTIVDGITFDSKKEAEQYVQLTLLKRSGRVLFFLRQVPFHLPEGIKYLADFVVFYSDGLVEVQDVKGVKTDVYKIKKKLVEANYPLTIKEI